MKKSVLNYYWLVILFSLFSTNLFAQTPPDPGNDPLIADSAKYISTANVVTNNKSTVSHNFSAEGNDEGFIHKTSDTMYLGKKKEESTVLSSK